MSHANLESTIRERLAPLEPQALQLSDDSAQHAGHAGSSGGAHYTLTLVSSHFTGKSRIMRHRIIYQALQDLIPSRIHALSISAYAPDEL